MTKSGRIARCMGRVEFRSCQIEILDMHKKGYANKHIYDKLAAQGRLTLAYSTFNVHLRKLLQAKKSKSIEIQSVDRKKIFEVPHNTELICNRQKNPFLRLLNFLAWSVPRRGDHGSIGTGA